MRVINPDGTLDTGGNEISIDAFVIGVTVIGIVIYAFRAREKKREREMYRMG